MKKISKILMLVSVFAVTVLLSSCLLLKPQAPTKLTAIALNAFSIKLSWEGSGEFIVYRAPTNVGAPFTQIATTNSKTYTDVGLTPSTTYYYEVRAKNKFGLSDPSNIASATTIPTNSVVVFPDPNLNAVVRAAIGKPTGAIYRSDLTSIATLVHNWPTINASKIVNLEGIQYCVNLKAFEIINNSVTDISLLASLTQLEDLKIWYNHVSDLTPIKNLANLKKLYIDFNPIPKSNWTFLKSWTWLKELGLGGMGLTNSDITFLSNFSNLVWLQIFNNSNIDDLRPIASLTNLEVLLINGNKITDLSLLSKLVNLWNLNAGENQISDLTPLMSLTNLKTLAVFSNQIVNISPLASLTNLQILSLNYNQVSDLTPLASLTNLQSLDLSHNQVENISPLVKNQGIGSGDYLDIRMNLLDITSNSTDMNDIQTLQKRNVTVLYDPQQ